MAFGRGPNYLRLTDEDFDVAIDDREVIETLEKVEQLMRSFATLDCTVCNHHFGYQHRQDPNVKVCSARCLSIAEKKLLSTSDVSSAASTLARVVNGLKKRENGSTSSLSGVGGHLKRGSDSPCMEFANDMGEIIAASSKLAIRDDSVKVNGVKENGDMHYKEKFVAKPTELLVKGGGAKISNGNDVADGVKLGRSFNPMVEPSTSRMSLSEVIARTKESEEKDADADDSDDYDKMDSSKMLSVIQKLVRPKPLAVKQASKKQWTMKDMVPSLQFYDNQKVMVFYMWSTTVFTINAIADEAKVYKMQEEIQRYVTKASPVSRKLEGNEIVFAAYGDEGYFRGCVIDSVEGGKYDIRFLDYGDRKIVPQSKCFEPSDEIMMAHPLYGVRFTMLTKREDSASLSELCGTAFEKVATSEPFTLEIKERNGDKWRGYLYRKDGTSLNDLVDELSAQLHDTEVPEVQPPTPVTSPVKTASKTQTSPPTTMMKFNPFLKPQEAEVKKKPGNGALPYTPNLKDGAQVSISFTWQPSRVTVNAVDDSDRLEELAEAVLACVEKKKGMTVAPDLNEIVIAKYDEGYYRGRVDAIEGDQVQVSFIDYGDKVFVKISECFEVDEEIMKFPIFGRVVKLVDIPEDSPDVNNAELSEASTSILVMNLVKAERDIFNAILRIDNAHTYNQLILKALNL